MHVLVESSVKAPAAQHILRTYTVETDTSSIPDLYGLILLPSAHIHAWSWCRHAPQADPVQHVPHQHSTTPTPRHVLCVSAERSHANAMGDGEDGHRSCWEMSPPLWYKERTCSTPLSATTRPTGTVALACCHVGWLMVGRPPLR